MNRDEFHYAFTACLTAEAMLAEGSMLPLGAADRAHVVATVDGMMDWLTPHHLQAAGVVKCIIADDLPLATQVRVQEGAAATLAGGFWPCMARVHRFHFQGVSPSASQLERLKAGLFMMESQIEAGVLFHGLQDAGYEGCPHWGYVGYPSRINWHRSQNLGRISWPNRALLKLRPGLRDHVWGHVLDPTADRIERCRMGALRSALDIFGMVSGRTMFWGQLDSQDGSGDRWIGPDKKAHDIRSILVLNDAKNDKDLEQRAGLLFEELTGCNLPKFAPFIQRSLQWKCLLQAVRQ